MDYTAWHYKKKEKENRFRLSSSQSVENIFQVEEKVIGKSQQEQDHKIKDMGVGRVCSERKRRLAITLKMKENKREQERMDNMKQIQCSGKSDLEKCCR